MFDKFVVHSKMIASQDAGNCFWSGSDGWTNLVCATVFSIDEMRAFPLSETGESDATWMPVAHAYDPSLISLCDIYDIAPSDLLNADGLEVQGVRDEDGNCEVCNEQPHFFSAYIHLTRKFHWPAKVVILDGDLDGWRGLGGVLPKY